MSHCQSQWQLVLQLLAPERCSVRASSVAMVALAEAGHLSAGCRVGEVSCWQLALELLKGMEGMSIADALSAWEMAETCVRAL